MSLNTTDVDKLNWIEQVIDPRRRMSRFMVNNIIVEKIPGAWLVQTRGGVHGLCISTQKNLARL
jgi:hypothetical protein